MAECTRLYQRTLQEFRHIKNVRVVLFDRHEGNAMFLNRTVQDLRRILKTPDRRSYTISLDFDNLTKSLTRSHRGIDRRSRVDRLPLYYFNTVHGDDQAGAKGLTTAEIWAEIEDSINSLQHIPKKMYHEGVFTFNNRLLVIRPESVPETLNQIYKMPEGQNKWVLLKLAESGASLVPCEEQQLLMAWNKSDTEMLKKEGAGETISADEIAKQSVYLLTRNKVIGQVIAQTLSKDEAGVLFLGCVHNLEGMMVKYLRDVLGLHVMEMNPHIR